MSSSYSNDRGTEGLPSLEGVAVLLTCAEFGNASAALDGMAPEAVAARLLQGLAETAMVRSDVLCLRDDKANPHGT